MEKGLWRLRKTVVAALVSLFTVIAMGVDAQTEDYSLWNYSRKFTINTTSSGANVSGSVTNFPLLLRLNALNASDVFERARSGGADIRFHRVMNGELGPSLSYEIERWDSAAQVAEIWVLVDTVFGNNPSQQIVMHWGKSDAVSRSNGAVVFDSAKGFMAVWHLGLPAGSLANNQARPNSVPGGQPAIPSGSDPVAGFRKAGGAIGLADTLRGGSSVGSANNDHFNIGSGYADFTAGLTMSLWVLPAAATITAPQKFISLGGTGTSPPRDNLGLARWNTGGQTLFAHIYSGTTGGEFRTMNTLAWEAWQLITFTLNGTTPKLYVNGMEMLLDKTTSQSTVNATRGFAYLGRTVWGNEAGYGGLMDEARIHKVARSADWIKLEYENQKPGSTVLSRMALPDRPGLSSPANGALSIPVFASLSWTSVFTATSYQIQVSTASNFPSTVFDTTVMDRSLVVGPLAFGSAHYWRVRAHNGEGFGPWSFISSFTTEPLPTTVPPAPNLTTPALFATQQILMPTLSWLAARGAVGYHVQLSSTPSFTPADLNDSAVTLTRTAGPLAGNREYYWRVRGRNSFGTGPWSDIGAFTTLTVPPEPPVQNLPAAFATGLAVPANLSWNTVSGATSYRIEVSLASNFSSYVILDSAVTGTARVISGLTGYTNYYWRVRAQNAAGVSDWSSVRRFTTGEVVALRSDEAYAGSHELAQVRLASRSFVRFRLLKREVVRMTVFDATGRHKTILTHGPMEPGLYRLPLPASLNTGTYWLEFRSEDNRQVLRLQP